MSGEDPEHVRLGQELLEAEALVLDGLPEEDGEVAVQRDVEGRLVRMGLEKNRGQPLVKDPKKLERVQSKTIEVLTRF